MWDLSQNDLNKKYSAYSTTLVSPSQNQARVPERNKKQVLSNVSQTGPTNHIISWASALGPMGSGSRKNKPQMAIAAKKPKRMPARDLLSQSVRNEESAISVFS
jgi:hypothetical protein